MPMEIIAGSVSGGLGALCVLGRMRMAPQWKVVWTRETAAAKKKIPELSSQKVALRTNYLVENNAF
jgi:hypothetical protein